MNPLWTLAPVSVLLGALMMWVFQRTTDRQALRETTKRIQAYLLEFWLFVDEPLLVWKSWKGLLIANARFYRLLLVPPLVLAIPMAPVYFCLDSLYGSSPLPIGKAALVTLGMNQPLDLLDPVPQLNAPDGISVESPAVRVFAERQVSWRIRPLRQVSGKLEWVLVQNKVEKSVAASNGFGYHSRKRTRSLVELLRYPVEALLPAGPVDWIEISYPSTTLPLLGVEAHWSIWFAAFSLIGAALSGKLRSQRIEF